MNQLVLCTGSVSLEVESMKGLRYLRLFCSRFGFDIYSLAQKKQQDARESLKSKLKGKSLYYSANCGLRYGI